MSDELLPYYKRERAYLLRLGAEFANANPRIAPRLRISGETVEDPHVSRLIDSVAFLNARIRKKLDDGFPELTEGLLSVLYPHFLAPVPSMAIAQFECDKELTGSYEVPADTRLESERVDGQVVRYRTRTPVTLWPIQVSGAKLEGLHHKQGVKPRAPGCAALLRVTLQTRTESQRFGALRIPSLRFFLHGQEQLSFLLYELLFHDLVEVAVASSAGDPSPARFGPEALRAVGFERHEGMLPCPARSFPGYRLLSEFFAFPARFLFFDVVLPESKLREAGRTLEVHFFLRRTLLDSEKLVTAETFALGCTPVVNLFAKTAEPEHLSHAESELRIVADARQPQAVEVYSVDRVTASVVEKDEDGTPKQKHLEFRPFYGLTHGVGGGHDDERGAWWLASRRAAPSSDEDEEDLGTEVYLSLVDLSQRSHAPEGWFLEVETTCLSRDLPSRLPVAPKLYPSEGGGPIRSIRCLTPPTRTLRRPPGDAHLWRLVSHLALNHLSLSGGGNARESLQEILRLYDIEGKPENLGVIEGILDVSARETSMRILSGGVPGFGRGTEVVLHLDEDRFEGSGAYLFGCVMERFLALYCSVNSYVQLALTTNRRQGELHRWAPRAGDHPLL